MARTYLEHANEGKSLTEAVTAERFSLSLEDRDLLSTESGLGYLAILPAPNGDSRADFFLACV